MTQYETMQSREGLYS